jgi:hypothetical protein
LAKHSAHILDMARKGAEHRYEELRAEMAALVKHFPHLTRRTGAQGASAISAGTSTAEAAVPAVRRQTKKMSAAARRAVSERMKKYWADRRKEKARK